MFPASTHKGQAVAAFPDVCKTPSSGSPVPMPYPNIGARLAGRSSKAPAGTKKPVAAKGASPQDLRAALDELHGKLMSMRHRDATVWHAVVDDYVTTAAAMFMNGKNIRG